MVHTKSFTEYRLTQLDLVFDRPSPVPAKKKRARLVNVPCVCEHCHTDFLAEKKRRFCTTACFGKDQSIRQAGAGNPGWKGGLASDHYHYKKLQVQRYPERILARRAVRHAVKSGKLVKQPCVCGATDVHAHHHAGYDRANRLNVTWLCHPCHREEHGGMRFAAKNGGAS